MTPNQTAPCACCDTPIHFKDCACCCHDMTGNQTMTENNNAPSWEDRKWTLVFVDDDLYNFTEHNKNTSCFSVPRSAADQIERRAVEKYKDKIRRMSESEIRKELAQSKQENMCPLCKKDYAHAPNVERCMRLHNKSEPVARREDGKDVS